MDKTKILIDTDIADEIDDAWALSLAMKENCEIVGVTTVFGNTEERARIAAMLLSSNEKYKDVPVFAGYGEPISRSIKEEEHIIEYTTELEDVAYAPTSKHPCDAVDFIIKCAAEYGQELKIICLGALTNIARACQRDADAINSVSEVIIMGGAYYKQYADWNVMCDISAAKIVFESLDNLVCIGADVTHRLDIGAEGVKRLLAYSGDDAALSFCRDQLALWGERVQGRTPCLHDPLAVYYALDKGICETENIPVVVIDEGYAKGITLNVDAYNKAYANAEYEKNPPQHKATVAKSVKKEEFIEYFLKMFS